MRIAAQDSVKPRRARASESMILFSVGRQMFLVAAESVQEIRSTDGLASAAVEISLVDFPKVSHFFERRQRHWFIVNACSHFHLPVSRPTLVLILRQARAALLVDHIVRMAEVSSVYALPHAFSGNERRWFRGLAYIEDQVIPVLDPAGVLTREEIARLDSLSATLIAENEWQGAAQS
ncbi:MAG TPA: chemotaxis protein CheW [Verrucomicrobiae bacterium]|nr:chemotaxis protein CheW [Verrucomicrobiae bacterium]